MKEIKKIPNEELLASLVRYSDLYYNEGTSPVTDEEFDMLAGEYERRNGKPFNTETPVREGKRLVDIGHDFPDLVGTLTKAYDMDEVSGWLKAQKAKLGKTNISITVSEKYDGNSVVLAFNHLGKFVSALTRGKDGKGLDLSRYFSHNEIGIPRVLEGMREGDMIGVKCEVLVTYDNFDKLSELLNKTYSNPRNLTAGILNSNDGWKYSEYLSIAPIMIDYNRAELREKNAVLEHGRVRLDDDVLVLGESLLTGTHIIRFNFYQFGEKVDKMYKYAGGRTNVLKVLGDLYNEYITKKRNERPYMTDGLVIEFSEHTDRDLLGRTGGRNNFDIALKFPSLTKRTTVKDIKWYMGKSGRTTPVAVVEPVVFNGAVCDHVSLSNIKRFRELDLHKGQSVILEYHGDVLSYLTSDPDVDPTTLRDEDRFPVIERCPLCKEELEYNESNIFLSCTNPTCYINQVGKIVNFFEKLNVKGVKEATVGSVLEFYALDGLRDLYDLTEEMLLEVGIGKKTSELVIRSVGTALRDVYDYQLFGSLGIEGIGRSKMEMVFEGLTVRDLINFDGGEMSMKSLEELSHAMWEIVGIGDKTIATLHAGMLTNWDDIVAFYAMSENVDEPRVNIKDTMVDGGVDGEDSLDIDVVFTGFRDSDLENFVKERGGKIRGSVSKNTDIVVAKDPLSSSSKVTKALELGKKVMSVDEFKAYVNY